MSKAVYVVRELAWIDGRRIVRHPASLAGFGLVAIGCTAFTRSAPGGLAEHGWILYAAFALLGTLVMVAANFVATRDRRFGTVEQHETVPTSATRRVWAALAALLAPLAVTLVLLGVVLAYAASQAPLPGTDVVVLASTTPLMLMLGSLGVVLARWVPNPFVAPALALGLYFWVPSDPQKPWEALIPLNPGDDLYMAAWHILYLLGLAVLLSSLALASARPRPASYLGAVVGAGIAATAAVAMLA